MVKFSKDPREEKLPIFGENLLADKLLLRQYLRAKQVLIVTNEIVAPLYLHYLQDAFSELQCDVIILADGEEAKSQHSLNLIFNILIEKGHNRDTTLVALGGGVITDLTGFAAATYMRGVNFLSLPTTLLAQVDAALGGKTAINHQNIKNVVGCFYHPQAIIIDFSLLHSLPIREFRAGFAEIIKYALLAGEPLKSILMNFLQQGFSLSSKYLTDIIKHCCKIKLTIVNADPWEQGDRVLLNLGHTFAHALESYGNYQRWIHGEAVAIGLYYAVLLSYNLGSCTRENLTLVDKLLELANLPRRIPADVDLLELSRYFAYDKKILAGKGRFILISDWGNCYVADNISHELLMNTLHNLRIRKR